MKANTTPVLNNMGDGEKDTVDQNSPDEHECPACDRAFDTLRGVKNHHVQAHGESIAGKLITCDWCGSETRIQYENYESHENNFCSRRCFGLFFSENYTGESHPEYEKRAIECDHCGEEFHRAPSRISENNFCSQSCKRTYFSENLGWAKQSGHTVEKVEVECDYCGQSHLRYPSHVEATRRNYCDSECQFKDTDQSGSNNYNWRGGRLLLEKLYEDLQPEASWMHQRERALKRDQYRCQNCRTTSVQETLEVHHIVPIKAGGANHLSNLISLCSSCHGKAESLARDIFDFPLTDGVN